MDRNRVIKAAYFAVLAVGDTPSQRTVQAMCKAICGKAFQTKDVLSFLRSVAVQSQSGSAPVAPTVLKSSPPVAAPEQDRSLHAGANKELELEDIPPNVGIVEPAPVLFVVPPAVKPVARRHPAASAAPWTADLRAQAWRLADVPLRELSLDDRFVLARYHALRFLNCAANESKNRARAARLVGSLAALGSHRDYGDYTVAEYVEGCQAVMNRTGSLIQSPWDFRGACERQATA